MRTVETSGDMIYEVDYSVKMDDGVLVQPQSLNLAQRMKRAVYLGLDEKI